MNPAVQKTAEQLKDFYGSLSSKARLVGAVVLLSAAGGLAYIIGTDRTEYTTLYNGLSQEDAGRIVEELKKTKTPYRLEGDGGTILVPEKSVHELRISLAGQGLPKGSGVGYEIFDNQKFGISDFAQQINYRRALQGELERTIGQIDAVKSARVHIALPNQQLFARQSRPVSASVTVRLHPGRTLSQASVKAIVHLVSSSISGLNAEAVTVVDAAGEMLWGGQKGSLAGSNGPLEYRQQVEINLERRVAELLDAAVGRGHSVVKVTAEVALAEVEQTEEQYDPDKTAVRSESTSEEKETSSGVLSGGIAGVRGNLPGGPEATGGDTKNGMSRKQQTRNYEVNKLVRRKVSPAGELQRISVAVLVDSHIVGDKSKNPTAVISSRELKDLEQIVRHAVGFSGPRGDMVTLRAVAFSPQQVEEPIDNGPGIIKLIKQKPIWIGGAAAVAVLTIVGFMLLLRRKKKEDVIQIPANLRDAENAMKQPLLPGMTGDEKSLGGSSTRQLAQAAASHDTARTAQVLRNWIGEGGK